MSSLLVAVLLFVLLFALLLWVNKPLYRLEPGNLVRLFDLVLSDSASDDDWNVFVEFPIRYQPDFEDIRLQCAAIADKHGRIRGGRFLLDESGKQLLREQRTRLLDNCDQISGSGEN